MRVCMHAHAAYTHSPVNLHAGTQNVLRVRLESSQTSCLIPFVRDIVPVVDTARQVMQLTPPEGLLDLGTLPTRPARKRAKRQQASGKETDAASSREEAGTEGSLR